MKRQRKSLAWVQSGQRIAWYACLSHQPDDNEEMIFCPVNYIKQKLWVIVKKNPAVFYILILLPNISLLDTLT